MPIGCRRTTTGGRGNRGMFIERDSDIIAAGLQSAQEDANISDSFRHYLLKEETDALIGDAIIPTPKKQLLPPLRKPKPLDMRYAGPFGQAADLLNPPSRSKMQILIEDIKETAYTSYWKAPVGKVRDPVPTLPEGFDCVRTTLGKPTPFHGRLYDVIMPRKLQPDNTLPAKALAAQVDRNYCTPPYRSDVTYGHRTYLDKRGTFARCCLSDDKILEGTYSKAIMNTKQSNFYEEKLPRLGKPLAPYDNISQVPEGYSFGILKPPDNLPQCLSNCDINPGVELSRKCLKHLNTLRKALSSRFLPTFFYKFYLTLKYHDKEKTGWLPKDIVYNNCGIRFIRFDPAMVEPLLSMWQAFDGSNIEYQTFIRVINYREPSPEIPKIPAFEPHCLDYRTTYTEMVKPGQEDDGQRMAGLPSGRYFDLDYPISPENCCKADRICLPHESDVKSCISPSIFTQLAISHRDMYEKQKPEKVRRIFEKAGELLSDQRFNAIWDEAQKLHTKGWVCYETFRQTLAKHPDPMEYDK